MSSFRRLKAEATLRLYSLPRRELQVLCKQYGVPANKTNVSMADALSACILAENGKSKASSGTSSLGVSKSTPMKFKVEKKTGLPEASLASFALNGKSKISPVKIAETVLTDDKIEAKFLRSTTTPLKRGIKRSERPLQTLVEEKSKITVVPAFTRAAAFQERLGKAAPAATHGKFGKSITAASSPKARASTPRKRSTEAAAIKIRRSRDALPAVSFSDFPSTPKSSESQVPEITPLNSTSRRAMKMKSRLSSRISSHEEEATLPLPKLAGGAKQPSRDKRVAFADEAEINKSVPGGPEPQPEPDTETIEVSYAEIEFKNPALHKELFGSLRSVTVEKEQVISPAPRQEITPLSPQKTGFEFKDMARHKELFGLCRNSENNCEGFADSLIDSEPVGISNCATRWVPSERSSFNASLLSPELLHNSTTPVHDRPLLPCIREGASGGLNSSVEVLEEHPERHLLQGHDLGPDLDGFDLAASRCERRMKVSGRSHGELRTCLNRVQSDSDIFISDEVQRFSHELFDKEEDKFFPTVAAMKGVVAAVTDMPMSGPERSAQIPATPMTTMQTNSTSNFGETVTPLTKIRNKIDSTLAKATSILEKLATWSSDAERKVREGYWEPKCSSIMEDPSAVDGFKTPTTKALIAKTVVDRDLPSAKKPRLTPKPMMDSEKEFIVCEDLDIVSKGDAPGAKKVRTPGESISGVSDKENQSEVSRKIIGLGREKKKGNKYEVLRDLSMNSSNENVQGIAKAGTGQVRPEEMSWRKLRATVKERVRQIEALKDSDTRTHKCWNMTF